MAESYKSKADATSNQGVYFLQNYHKHFNFEETYTRFKYLLGLTDLFQHFISTKAKKDENFEEVLRRIEIEDHKQKQKAKNHRERKSEKQEDAELLDNDTHVSSITEFTESPGFIHGDLRPYQIQGLNWLISLHENNLSGILADEMGLGKTLQTIAFLGYLRYVQNINGPHIIVVPKSTLDNWAREFSRWTPEVNVLVLSGDKDTRSGLIQSRLMTCDFDVVIGSYETVLKEKSSFKKFAWQYIIIDEAHRIKNEESMLSQIIRMFQSRNRLLITGTPLQNNLHELWALLNFLLPDVFSDSEAFDQWFQNKEGDDESKGGNLVLQLHKVLKPFLLRRIKSDVEKSLLPKKETNVYLKFSDMQKKWYQKILEKDIDAVNGSNKKESKTRLLNIVMQLRKCCNHPYLFEGAEPGPPFTTDTHLIYNAQKMVVLDSLLRRFKEQGSRVLIFSQMSRMLDILEDYCSFRDYEYSRIDGQTDHGDRVNSIDEFNEEGSSKFIFLLTTRAGGLGINLASADVVIIYDSDWNPQADLQAMDRAHRIGQTKQVKVFRFVTENTVEEKILERAAQKLRLDQLVIQQGRNTSNVGQQSNKAASKDELLNMIQYGAEDMFQNDTGPKPEGKEDTDDLDIDALLAASEGKTNELNRKYSKLDLSALQNFSNDDSVYEWNGENFKKKEPQTISSLNNLWLYPSKRERKENYSIDMYYKDVLNTGSKSVMKNGPRAPKQLNIYDHQFYPPKLFELTELEKNYYKKQIGYEVPLKDGTPQSLRERELEQKLEMEEIENSRPLTEEEKNLKEELLRSGYSNWNRKNFLHFIHLCSKYGRNAILLIASEFEDKNLEEVREYAKKFWTSYEEIDGYERYISQIEMGEERIVRTKLQKESLRRKMSHYRYPLQELTLKYPPMSASKKTFTEDEDRFLLVQLFRFGLDRPNVYDLVRDAIRDSPLFEFDFFFQSRNTAELARRGSTLLACVLKEIHPNKRKLSSPQNGSKKVRSK